MADDNKKSIFDDAGFNKEAPEEKSFGDGFYNLVKGIGQIFKGLWHILSKKFKMNLIVLLLIISLVGAVVYFAESKPQAIKGNESEITPIEIALPSNMNVSLFEADGIEDIIAENCMTEGLEKTLIDLSCPVAECPICESKECAPCLCKDENVNVIYYQCLDGEFVQDRLNCR